MSEQVDQKTVFDSTENFNVVHPLKHEWTFWYTKPNTGSGEDWRELIKELVTVDTVEEFWGAYNSLPKFSELPRKADYALFRKGIRPEWEDPANENGGKWVFQYKGLASRGDVDDKWLNVLLGVIGGSLDNEDKVNGVVAMVRHSSIYKIALWVSGNHEESKTVALRFKDLLDLAAKDHIEFALHDSSRKRGNAITL